ncbi:MAG: hypothetical protein K0Q87_1817 [Neobacillus sp.]|jgi:hypothetical protein|nr:hypothetical protein [Neobacillus sp.]
MYKLIDFLKYFFFICYWKITDLWKRTWRKKKVDTSEFMKDQRSDIVLLNIESYHSLFAAPTQHPEIFMSQPIFEKIIHSLPPNYVLPDLKTLKNIVKTYNKPATVLDESELNEDQVFDKIKASVPRDYILPLSVGTNHNQPSQLSNQRINFVKTFVPNVSPDLQHSSLPEINESSTKPEAQEVHALSITPLESRKKIIQPIAQQSAEPQPDKYKFVFFK